MFFRKRHSQRIAKEAEIQKIRRETLKKIETATKSTKKVNDLLEEDGDFAAMFWHATHSPRRKK